MGNYPSFEESYGPQLRNTFGAEVRKTEDAVNRTSQITDADEAEESLDEACDELKRNCNKKIDEMKEEVKQKRPKNPTAEEEQRYAQFIGAMAVGFRTFSNVLNAIFQRLRDLIATVIDWIRRGIAWTALTVREAFSAIRSLLF